MGSPLLRQPESPREEPGHWQLAVLERSDPALKACGETPATHTYVSPQSSQAAVPQHFHYYYCGGDGGCGSCYWLGHRMRKKNGKAASLVFLFSCCLCPVLGPGRVQRNREKRMSVWHGQAVGVGGETHKETEGTGGSLKIGENRCAHVYTFCSIFHRGLRWSHNPPSSSQTLVLSLNQTLTVTLAQELFLP